jgi:putative acyl-CoA dehydrogenase
MGRADPPGPSGSGSRTVWGPAYARGVATHDVTNQVPIFTGHNLFRTDAVLVEAMRRWGDPADDAGLDELGAKAGSATVQQWADQVDRVTPILRTHARSGERLDEVEYHPSYHALMSEAVGAGLTASPWTSPADSGAHLRRAAGFLVWSQAEAGHLCPISMTYAAAPAVRHNAALAERLIPGLAATAYDPVLRPLADKVGLLAGMGMTEKQGGSDVRANTTRAVAVPGGPIAGGETYRLTGHKWFCSAPMSDVFLILAQTEAGVGCFLVPRVLDDGSRNPFALQRLKDKLGNRSNASSEVEFDGTWGVRVGDDGRGVRTIIDMVASTRLDCILGSSAGQRLAVVRAIHHARHRAAFGARLIDQPLMRNVLADLALEVEAAEQLAMRLAHAVDAGESDFSRLGVALGKFWVCKRTSAVVGEALECLGGAGYVEENGLARLYREAPLNSIWEGSGNVNALDVLRATTREPASVAALSKELAMVRGRDSRLDMAIDEVEQLVVTTSAQSAAWNARRIVERMALTLQGALVVEHSPAPVAEAFLATRFGGAGGHGSVFGTLGEVSPAQVEAILDRAFAEV